MKKITQILHGGDYNPEQWPCEAWEEDLWLLPEIWQNGMQTILQLKCGILAMNMEAPASVKV